MVKHVQAAVLRSARGTAARHVSARYIAAWIMVLYMYGILYHHHHTTTVPVVPVVPVPVDLRNAAGPKCVTYAEATSKCQTTRASCLPRKAVRDRPSTVHG